MNRRFAILSCAFVATAVVFGESADGPVVASNSVPTHGAADYLRAAMQELHGGTHLDFSSKADFISPDDNIDAGVVREGPEMTDGVITASERAEQHEHSRHAQQMIRFQHKPTHDYQKPANNQQSTTEYQSPVYQPQHHNLPPAELLSEQPPSDYLPQQQPDNQADSVPPLSKEELAALYEAALQKGSQLDLSTLPGGVESLADPSVGSMPGYYYYYYPIKELPKKEGEGEGENGQKGDGDDNSMGNAAGNQMVEPLFVAVAAFVSMSVLFMFTMIFLPKFGFFRSDSIGLISRLAPDDLSGLTRVVLESVDGKDCDQRIACELGRVLRKLRMHDRPLRMLEVMLSKPAQKQIQEVRRAAIYKTKCNAIRCKRKSARA